jgi:hypothetical protein
MRMLRLGAGWSAEKLSQEYGSGGAGELTRTTIAKIERDIRPIKAGEVDGVARVFGLTANDLLDTGGPKVFLSYADQDGGTGQEVAAWLGDRGFRLLSAEADAAGPGSTEGRAIDAAHAFVVVLSPSFLSSPRCQQELNLAVRRERQLLAAGSATGFIFALQVTAGLDLDDSGLSSYLSIDLPASGDRSRDVALSKLGGSILSSTRVPDIRADPLIHVPASPQFLDRGEELGRVLNALSNSSGASFWLVTSPPGLGKSWLLNQLKEKAAEPAAGGWVTSLVDLGPAGPAEAVGGGQHDAVTVVRGLFGDIQRQPSDDEGYIRGVAQDTMRDGQPRLCLLDSAELLSADTIKELRQHLGTIYRRVQDSGRDDARLAFVAASRRDDGWRGILPPPEPAVLQLAGFGPGAIQEALEALARDIPVVRSPAELRRDAEFVQHATEGVPELVRQSLQWIRAEQWLDIERLETQQVFDEIMAPYIRDHLLTQGSLLPAAADQPAKRAKRAAALREGLRVLVPYRFITASHVNRHADDDRDLRDALKGADWEADDLWRAIAGTALLLPLDELWREIHPAVRRLLFRYFYTAEDKRAGAHTQAADFTKTWAARLPGKEQAAGLVESIWHKAVTLRLTSDSAAKMGEELVISARTLSCEVRASDVYSKDTLRNYAVQRMKNDDELQCEVAQVEGLFEKLILVVASPEVQDV